MKTGYNELNNPGKTLSEKENTDKPHLFTKILKPLKLKGRYLILSCICIALRTLGKTLGCTVFEYQT